MEEASRASTTLLAKVDNKQVSELRTAFGLLQGQGEVLNILFAEDRFSLVYIA